MLRRQQWTVFYYDNPHSLINGYLLRIHSEKGTVKVEKWAKNIQFLSHGTKSIGWRQTLKNHTHKYIITYWNNSIKVDTLGPMRPYDQKVWLRRQRDGGSSWYLSRDLQGKCELESLYYMSGICFNSIWGGGRVKMIVAQSCPTLCNSMDYTVHRILQVRVLEWVSLPFSRGSSQPRDRTQVSSIAGRFFTSWATREAQEYWSG